MTGANLTRASGSLSCSKIPGPHRNHARLLRSLASPQQFTSISEWDTAGARDAWKASPAFREGFEASKALCDEFLGGDYDEAVIVRPTTEPS
jgi:heme-degrading monooxygenase HmoA